MRTFCSGTKTAAARVTLAVAGVALAAPLGQAQAQATLQASAAAAGGDARARKRGAAKAAPALPAMPSGRVELAPQMLLSEGKSTLMHLPYAASRLAVGDPRVADVILLNPSEVYLLGKTVGTTNLILWNRNNDATVIDLAVGIDTVALQARIAQLMPGERDIRITAAADTLILSGTVADSVKAEQALALANAYVQRGARAGAAASTSTGANAGAGAGDAQAAPKVVMLEVKVAEVSKTLVDQLGASLGLSRTIGNVTYSLLSNLLAGKPGLVDAFSNKNGNFATLDAQKRDGLVKVLAEPTIMAISGQEASFLAGGKIFIPVSQTNNSGQATITLEEKEFGVAVKFTPTVLEGGRINLKVAPEVSDLNKDGIGITASGINGTAILPSFTTRRATTTVQLFDGQSFAIGGLIKNNVTTNIKALPMLGEVPVLGALFRSSDFQTDRTELVFIITPHLVKPLPPDYKLPTDPYVQPTRADFFLQGKMEGPPREQQEAAPAAQPPVPPAAPAAGFDVK